MSSRRLHAASLLILALPSLAGCAAFGLQGSDDTVRIATATYPLQEVARQVARDDAEVSLLTRPGQEPHDLELTVQQTAEVDEADLVLYVGGLQPAVDEAVDSVAGGATLDALEVLAEEPPAIPGARPLPSLGDDPHFWLDPRAMATVTVAVAAELARLDPDHADDYTERGQELVGRLVELDGRLSTGLDDCRRRTVVVSHDAFGWFGHRYDLDVVSIAGLSPEAEPSPAHLGELADLATERGVTTVFGETLASPELAETLAGELGLRTAVLDPVEGLSDETSDEDYFSLMLANLDALRTALDCT